MAKGRLSALPYFGGKSPTGTGVGPWIASQLPMRRLYVETHGGMFGVGLCRDPSPIEIYNDLEDRVVNWWGVVQRDWHRLVGLLRTTPYSRKVYNEARQTIDEGTPLERALKMSVVLWCSRSAVWTEDDRFIICQSRPAAFGRLAEGGLEALASRMRKVIIECRDATEVLHWVKNKEDAVVYVDPPYRTAAHVELYNLSAVDTEPLTEALLAQRGAVAISGYGSEWDHLGWRREEFSTWAGSSSPDQRRTEVLWLNFEVDRGYGRGVSDWGA